MTSRMRPTLWRKPNCFTLFLLHHRRDCRSQWWNCTGASQSTPVTSQIDNRIKTWHVWTRPPLQATQTPIYANFFVIFFSFISLFTGLWRFLLALTVFAKHNRLSCVACWADRDKNQECFSNGMKSTTYKRWSCTIYHVRLLVGFVNKKWCCWFAADKMMNFLNVCYFTMK